VRVLTLVAAALLLAATLGCGGKKRHVVVDPAEMPGHRGDGWRITGEPAGARPPAER
jgi:hypothetical protein